MIMLLQSMLVRLVVLSLPFVESNPALMGEQTPRDFSHHHVVRLKLPERYGQPKFEAQAISNDSQFLAITCENSQVALIKIATGDIVAKIPASVGQVIDISFSRDGTRLYLIGTTGQKLFDVKLGREIAFSTNLEKADLGIELVQRNGKWLIQSFRSNYSGDRNRAPRIGDEITGIGEGKSGPIESVLGKDKAKTLKLLPGPVETTVQLQFVSAGEFDKEIIHLRRLREPGAVNPSANASSDPFAENMAWCLSNRFHTFINVATGKIVRSVMPEEVDQRTGTPALSADGQKYAFLGKVVETKEYAIEVFDVRSGNRLAKIDNVLSHAPSNGLTNSSFNGLQFSSDNKHLFVGAWDRICVYDIDKQSYHSSFNLNHNVPVSERITRKSDASGANLMEIALNKTAGGVDRRDATANILVKVFNVSGQGLLATGSWNGLLCLWNLNEGELIHTFGQLPEERIENIEFSPDGNWLTFFVHGELHLVNVGTVKPAR